MSYSRISTLWITLAFVTTVYKWWVKERLNFTQKQQSVGPKMSNFKMATKELNLETPKKNKLSAINCSDQTPGKLFGQTNLTESDIICTQAWLLKYRAPVKVFTALQKKQSMMKIELVSMRKMFKLYLIEGNFNWKLISCNRAVV